MADILNLIPRRFYQFDQLNLLVSNLTANVNVSDRTQRQTTLFLDYRVKSRETARQICTRLYEDDTLYWTVYLVNGITNEVEGWPRRDLDDWLNQRYTAEQLAEVVRYADIDRNSVDLFGLRHLHGLDDAIPSDEELIAQFNLTPITRAELYRMEDDKKRSIRLVDPDYIEEFVGAVRGALA